MVPEDALEAYLIARIANVKWPVLTLAPAAARVALARSARAPLSARGAR